MYNVMLNNPETSGAIAYKGYHLKQDCPPENPNCGKVNFLGRDNYHKEKSEKAGKVLIGLAVIAATVIGGIGYAHKIDVLSKIKNEKLKDALTHFEPAAKTCHKWCSQIKKKGSECLEKIKNIFKRKS